MWEDRSDATTFAVAIDLPGVDKQDAEVVAAAEDGFLRVWATRKRPPKVYALTIPFPKSVVDADTLGATLTNGVLVIRAPKHRKHPRETRRRIPIS